MQELEFDGGEIESANKRTLPSSPFLPSVWTPAMNEDANLTIGSQLHRLASTV
jgi:hypothetical protein